jgi:hypothetical protein
MKAKNIMIINGRNMQEKTAMLSSNFHEAIKVLINLAHWVIRRVWPINFFSHTKKLETTISMIDLDSTN